MVTSVSPRQVKANTLLSGEVATIEGPALRFIAPSLSATAQPKTKIRLGADHPRDAVMKRASGRSHSPGRPGGLCLDQSAGRRDSLDGRRLRLQPQQVQPCDASPRCAARASSRPFIYSRPRPKRASRPPP
ncbi:hypothetical protein ACTMU2_34530 [Cupriavidus basilensis]